MTLHTHSSVYNLGLSKAFFERPLRCFRFRVEVGHLRPGQLGGAQPRDELPGAPGAHGVLRERGPKDGDHDEFQPQGLRPFKLLSSYFEATLSYF